MIDKKSIKERIVKFVAKWDGKEVQVRLEFATYSTTWFTRQCFAEEVVDEIAELLFKELADVYL